MTVPGGSPLNYPTNAQPSLKRIVQNRAPTSNDYKNFCEGDEWLDKPGDDWWKLADITGGVATWVKIGGTAGAVESFVPDSGTSPVVPDASNLITTTGANGITVVGGTNTLTFTTSNGELATKFIPDTGTDPVVPDSAGEVTFTGGTGIITTGGTNEMTWDVDGSVVTTQYDGDTGSATPSAGVLNIVGGNGTVSSAVGNTVTVEMQSPFTGDFTFTQDSADETLTVSSTTSGDPSIVLTSDNTSFNQFLDNTGSLYQMRQGSNVVLQSTTAGEITKPLTPAFLARSDAATAQNNVTGNGTIYTVLYPDEIFDVGSNYSSPTFTAPVDGIYEFFASTRGDNLTTSSSDVGLGFNFSTGEAGGQWRGNGGAITFSGPPVGLVLSISYLIELDAGDTAEVNLTISGMPGDSVDIGVTSTMANQFGGYLLG